MGNYRNKRVKKLFIAATAATMLIANVSAAQVH